MKNFTKILSILAVFTFIFAGCSKTDDSNSDKNTIVVAVDKNFISFYKDAADAFMAENEGVTVKVEEADMLKTLEGLPTQLENAADVFMLPNDRIGDLADKKLIAPVDVDLSSYSETAQTGVEYNGETYTLPMSIETTLLIRNTDLLPDEPKTLAELGPEKFLALYTNFYYAAGMFFDNGGYIFGDDVTDIGLNNEGSVKGAKNIQSLYQSGDETWTLMQDDSVAGEIIKDKFLTGEVATIIDGPWVLSDIEKAGINFEVSAIPSYDGNGEYQALTGLKGVGVNAYSKNSEVAQNFVKFLNTEEYSNKWHEDTSEVSPDTRVVYEDGSVAAVVSDATSKGYPMPTYAEFGKVWVPMADALKQIATGADVEASLDAAVEAINNDIAASN